MNLQIIHFFFLNATTPTNLSTIFFFFSKNLEQVKNVVMVVKNQVHTYWEKKSCNTTLFFFFFFGFVQFYIDSELKTNYDHKLFFIYSFSFLMGDNYDIQLWNNNA